MPEMPSELYDLQFSVLMNELASGDEDAEDLVWSFEDYV